MCGGNEDERNKWQHRKKSPHLWSRYCSASNDPQSLTIALSIVFPSSSHAPLLIYPQRLSISLSRFVFPNTLSSPPHTHTHTHTHTSTTSSLPSLFSLSIPSLPSQLSRLPLSRAHSFITGHHRRRGRLKRTTCPV